MKKILILFIFLLTITCVSASSYDFKTIINYNSTLSEEGSIGELLILRNGFLPENKYNSNYTNIEVDIYDKFYWLGQESIQISNSNSDTILTPNNYYIFNQIGTYRYSSLTNSSKNGTINIKDIKTPIINISYEIYRDNQTYYENSINNIALNSDEKLINLPYKLNQNAIPGVYDVTTKITSNYKNIELNNSLLLKKILSFDVITNTILKNTSLSNGEVKDIGKIVIKNTGNSDYNLTSQVNGNGSSFIIIQEEQRLYKDLNTVFNIVGNSPLKQDNGKYNINIGLSNQIQSYNYSFDLIIKDSIKPTIEDFNIKHRNIYKDNEIEVKANDNNGIDSAKLNIFMQNYTITNNQTKNYNKTYEFDIIDNTVLKSKFKIPREGDYNLTICVKDIFENEKCEDFIESFSKLDIVSNNNYKKLLSTKIGKFTSDHIFTLNENISTTVRLKEFTTDIINDTFNSYKIQLSDKDKNIFDFESINSSITINQSGNYTIKIRSENIIEYSGILEFLKNNYSISENNIKFEGKFLNYSVATPGTKEWLNGLNLTIKVHDTGIYETSYTESCVRHSIDTDIDSLSVPSTPKEIEVREENFQLKIDQKNKNLLFAKIGIGFSIVISAILILYLYYTIKIMPYKRVKYGKEDKE